MLTQRERNPIQVRHLRLRHHLPIPNDVAILKRVNDSLCHRGPDDNGCVRLGVLALTMRSRHELEPQVTYQALA